MNRMDGRLGRYFFALLFALSLLGLTYFGFKMFPRHDPFSFNIFWFVVFLFVTLAAFVGVLISYYSTRVSGDGNVSDDGMRLEDLTVKDPEMYELYGQFKQLQSGLEQNLSVVDSFRKKMEAEFAKREQTQQNAREDADAWEEELSTRQGEAGKFEISRQVVKAFNSVATDKELYQYLIQMTAKVTSSARASVMLVDQSGEALSLFLTHGWEPEKAMFDTKVPFGQGFAGDVAKNKKRMLVSDVESEAGRDNKPGYKSKSFVILPIVCGDQVVGVLNLTDKPGGDIYSFDDLEMLNLFLEVASLALKGLV